MAAGQLQQEALFSGRVWLGKLGWGWAGDGGTDLQEASLLCRPCEDPILRQASWWWRSAVESTGCPLSLEMYAANDQRGGFIR